MFRSSTTFAPELEFMIIDFLQDDKKGLVACSTVCHDWQQHSRKFLFHTLSVACDQDEGFQRFTEFLRSLRGDDGVTIGYVRNLKLHGSKQAKRRYRSTEYPSVCHHILGKILPLLPNLTTLELKNMTIVDCCDVERDIERFQLSRLHIHRVFVPRMGDMLQFLHHFSAIDTLEVGANQCVAYEWNRVEPMSKIKIRSVISEENHMFSALQPWLSLDDLTSFSLTDTRHWANIVEFGECVYWARDYLRHVGLIVTEARTKIQDLDRPQVWNSLHLSDCPHLSSISLGTIIEAPDWEPEEDEDELPEPIDDTIYFNHLLDAISTAPRIIPHITFQCLTHIMFGPNVIECALPWDRIESDLLARKGMERYTFEIFEAEHLQPCHTVEKYEEVFKRHLPGLYEKGLVKVKKVLASY